MRKRERFLKEQYRDVEENEGEDDSSKSGEHRHGGIRLFSLLETMSVTKVVYRNSSHLLATTVHDRDHATSASICPASALERLHMARMGQKANRVNGVFRPQ